MRDGFNSINRFVLLRSPHPVLLDCHHSLVLAEDVVLQCPYFKMTTSHQLVLRGLAQGFHTLGVIQKVIRRLSDMKCFHIFLDA